MLKKAKLLLILVVLVMLAGCVTKPTSIPVVMPTIVAPVFDTPEPQIVYVTATPESPENVITATPEVTATPDASISIQGIDDMGGGKAMVHWEPVGNFPSGYVITWSDVDQKPEFPKDPYTYSSDPATRSAIVTLDLNKIYFLRVCRLVNSTCDVYSNLGIFALINKPTVVPTVTRTPTKVPGTSGSGTGATSTPAYYAFNASGTPISSSSGITIKSIASTGTSGQAKITWTATGTFSSGFIIVYSTSYAKPYYGGYEYYVVADSSLRTAYVTGTPGYTYYYRLCRRTGTSCDIYSNTVTFTYPGATPTPTKTLSGSYTATPTKTPTITTTSTTTTTATSTNTPTPSATPDPAAITISSVKDTESGKATLNWTSTGDFPYGYIVTMSDTHTIPDLTDTTIHAASGTTSLEITGTAGTKYYIRMCKLNGSSCINYSSVKEFTFAKITLGALTQKSEGVAHLTWASLGDMTNGFWWMETLGTDEPVSYTYYSARGTIADGSTTSGDFSVVPGMTHYFRLCQANASTPTDGCLIYSDVLSLYFPSSLVITSPATKVGSDVTLDWTGPTGTPYTFDGYMIFRSDQTTALDTVSASTLTYTDTSVPAGTHTYLICASEGSTCVGYSENDVTVTIP